MPWCRACGQSQAVQTGVCSSCGVDLGLENPDPTPVGLAFPVRSKLDVGKRVGICLNVSDDSLLLHFSAKDKELTRVPLSTPAADVIPHHLCAATRFLYAANLSDPKLAWDRDALRSLVVSLCGDVRVRRRVVDEALGLGWPQIVDWVSLSPSEKAWRAAHHAAAARDTAGLLDALCQLPESGYPTRGELLLPFLGEIRRQPTAWRPVLERLVAAQVPHATDIAMTTIGDWHSATTAGVRLLPAEHQPGWSSLHRQLSEGSGISRPRDHSTPAWSAASLLSAPDHSGSLDPAINELLSLEPALLDDLIDNGRLSGGAALAARDGLARTYAVARLAPWGLTDDELRRIGHSAELARRLFVSRDRASLSGLAPTPRVTHYQALLDVVEGGRPDGQRLDAATSAQLALPNEVLGQIKDGTVRTLPDALAGDPSLWPMFGEQAIAGKLLADPSRPADHPLNTWIGLLRLMGLVWSGAFGEAAEHGAHLLNHLRHERSRDEALNLTAFALAQLGRSQESLHNLESALAGDYTENLLVNVSIVAAQVDPEIGVRHLARLVEKAPPELQRAGLLQALGMWQGSDQPFPTVLIPALRTALSTPQPVQDFLLFGGVAVGEAPEIVLSLRNPGGELDGPFRIVQARARFMTDDTFYLEHLADAYITVYRSVGRPDWFNTSWARWVDTVHESLFVEFGKALGSAGFIDKVLVNAPELFVDTERFVMAPQAGSHYAAAFAKDDSTLNDGAWHKFFFGPVDEFVAKRTGLASGTAAYLADNFTRCLALAATHTLEVARNNVAGSYNPLVERQSWDVQNRYALEAEKRRILDVAESGPVAVLDQAVGRLRRLASDADDMPEIVRGLGADVEEWRQEIRRLRGGG